MKNRLITAAAIFAGIYILINMPKSKISETGSSLKGMIVGMLDGLVGFVSSLEGGVIAGIIAFGILLWILNR